MLTPDFLAAEWGKALDYTAYVATGTPEQQKRWNTFHAAVAPTAEQTAAVGGYTRVMHVLTVSGVWCGDCVEQVPFLDHLAAANPDKLRCRYLDRDLHKGLSSQLKLCAGDRVPVVLLLSEDFDFCALAGDRSISRYRAKAARELGAACSTGLFLPPAEERAATLADWFTEIERVQLMLRLSPRYRKKYQD